MSNVKLVNSGNFETEVLKSEQPVLVDFYADWCGPCNALAPTIEKVAAESEGKFKIFKLNTDESPDIAKKYNVKSIPMLIVFKNGEPTKTRVGNTSAENIIKLFE